MLSRLTFNIEQVADATTNSTGALIRETLTIIGLIAWLFSKNWKLALFVVILAPPLSYLVRQVTKSFRRYSARIQASMGDVTRVTKEALDGQRVIKVFNAQDQEAREFETVNEHNRRSNMKLIAAKATSNPIVQFIASLGLGGVLWMALVQINSGDMTIGEFWGFLTALLLTTAPMRSLVTALGPLQQGLAAGASVFEVLDEPTEDFNSGRKARTARGAIDFRDVSFEYTSEKGGVLHSINLSVPAGSNIAIVGRSGSGKSTLVGLVPRFYDATSGHVLVDGIDVRECNLRDLARQRGAGQPGRAAVQRFHPQQHRLRRREPGSESGGGRGARPPTSTNSRPSCRRASTLRWAIVARCFRAASASASPSHAPCSRTHPS